MGDPSPLGRSDSDVTGRPMSEEDYRALERELAGQGHTVSGGIQRLVGSQPEVEAGDRHWASESTRELNSGQFSILRADTLEINPVCVDPNSFQPAEEQLISETTTQHTQLLQTLSGNHYIVTNEVKHEPLVVQQDNTVAVVQRNNQAVVQLTQQQQQEEDQRFSAWSELTDRYVDYQLGCQQTQLNSLAAPSATSSNPATTKWPGDFEFKVSFQRLTENTKTKSWDFSTKLNKLFIDMGKDVMVSFGFSPHLPDGCSVRATPIYAVASHLKEPVVRCPNHAAVDDPSNRGVGQEDHLFHLIRMGHDRATYELDQSSQRLSVRVPVERPQAGTAGYNVPMKFMCLGSDVGGMNRRPIKVIFTLEAMDGIVIGRQSLDVRICSCPRRDRAQDEKRAEDVEREARRLADGLGKRTSSMVFTLPRGLSPSSKKRRIDSDDDMIMMPVGKANFAALNEIAEDLLVATNPSRAHEVKAKRRRLIEKYNPNLRLKREKSISSEKPDKA